MDLEIIETGNGGDLVKKPKDLSVIDGFENMVYLAMFGGNVEASTPTERIFTEHAFDFWGNSLLMPNDPDAQFNSLTERTLRKVALNSTGRLLIEQSVKKDLEFMRSFAVVKVLVSVISTDRILIAIQVVKPSNLQSREFIYIWDATLAELLTREIITKGGGNVPTTSKIFGPEFDESFE